MRVRIQFDHGNVITLEQVKSFGIEANNEDALTLNAPVETPEFIKRRINEFKENE